MFVCFLHTYFFRRSNENINFENSRLNPEYDNRTCDGKKIAGGNLSLVVISVFLVYSVTVFYICFCFQKESKFYPKSHSFCSYRCWKGKMQYYYDIKDEIEETRRRFVHPDVFSISGFWHLLVQVRFQHTFLVSCRILVW